MDSVIRKGGAVIAIAAALWIFYFALVYGSQSTLWTDEGDYVLLAKSIATQGRFMVMPDPFGVLDTSTRSFEIPYFAASTSYMTGGDYILAGRLAVALLCGLAVLATYMLARRLFGDLAAIFAVILLAFSHLFWFYSSRVLTDAPQMLFAALGLYAFLRMAKEQSPKWMVVFVLSILLGGFSKYTFFSIVLGLAVGALIYRDSVIRTAFKSRTALAACILIFLGFAAALVLYSYSASGSAFGLAQQYFSGAESFGVSDTWLYFSQSNWVFNNVYGAILVALGVVYAFLKRDDNAVVLAATLLLPLLFMTFFLVYKEDRFALFLLPIAFVLAGRLLSDALMALVDVATGKAAIGFWAAVSAVLLLMLFSASYGNIGQCWGLYESKQSSYYPAQEAAYFVQNITKSGDWVMADGYDQIAAYSGRYSLDIDQNYSLFQTRAAALNSTVYVASYLERPDVYTAITALQNGTALPDDTYYNLFADTGKYQLLTMFTMAVTAQNGTQMQQPVVFVFKKL